MRSLLFVPGDDERKIAKGLASAADALILDLEDSVAPPRKAAARELCARTLAEAGAAKKLFVRINALDRAQALLDLSAVVKARPFGIVLPKCRGADDVVETGHYLSALEARDGVEAGATAVLPIVTETAVAMLGLQSYGSGSLPRLFGMMWGGEDLAADLGAAANRDEQGRYAAPYQHARTACLFASAAACALPIDAVYTNFRDTAGLEAEARDAVRDGFVAKAAIHPDQIGPIHAAFTPSQNELDWAQRVVAAFDAAPDAGVASIDGRMLDRPHYRSAQRVIARAAASQR